MPTRSFRMMVLGLALALGTAAAAQQKAPDQADPAAVAAARELLVAMGSLNQFEIAINAALPTFSRSRRPPRARKSTR